MQADSLPVGERPCSYWTATPWPVWVEPLLLTCFPASAVAPAPGESSVATLQYAHQLTSMSSPEDSGGRIASGTFSFAGPVAAVPARYFTLESIFFSLHASAVAPAQVESTVATLQYVHQVTSMSSSGDSMSRQATTAFDVTPGNVRAPARPPARGTFARAQRSRGPGTNRRPSRRNWFVDNRQAWSELALQMIPHQCHKCRPQWGAGGRAGGRVGGRASGPVWTRCAPSQRAGVD